VSDCKPADIEVSSISSATVLNENIRSRFSDQKKIKICLDFRNGMLMQYDIFLRTWISN
jgi:hypothetical protein